MSSEEMTKQMLWLLIPSFDREEDGLQTWNAFLFLHLFVMYVDIFTWYELKRNELIIKIFRNALYTNVTINFEIAIFIVISNNRFNKDL